MSDGCWREERKGCSGAAAGCGRRSRWRGSRKDGSLLCCAPVMSRPTAIDIPSACWRLSRTRLVLGLRGNKNLSNANIATVTVDPLLLRDPPHIDSVAKTWIPWESYSTL